MTRCKPRNRCVFEVEHGFRAVMLDGGVEGWRADDDRKHRSETLAMPHATDAAMVRAAFEGAGWAFVVAASGAVVARHRMQTRRRVKQAGTGTLSSRRLREAVAGRIDYAPSERLEGTRFAATCESLGITEAGPVGLRDLLRWVCLVQLADVRAVDDGAPMASAGFSVEYVIIQRQRLGCSVDGASGSNPLHPDAELVADAIQRTVGRAGHIWALIQRFVLDGLPAWAATVPGANHGEGAGQREYIRVWEVAASLWIHIDAVAGRFQRYTLQPFAEPREPWRGITRIHRDWPDTSRIARWGLEQVRKISTR